jgi:hypothetical protein
MKTYIDSQKGVHTHRDNDGVFIEGKDHKEAPFDNRWDDLRAIVNEGTGPASLTFEPYRDTGFYMRFFRHNQTDRIFMTYQMPHGWDTKSEVRPHMHMIPMGSASGSASFDFSFTWSNIDEMFSGSSGWTSGSVTVPVSALDQYSHKIINFGAILPHSAAKPSSILVFKVERNISVDTYESSKDHGTAAANIAILEFDLHYQQLKAGTVGEFE